MVTRTKSARALAHQVGDGAVAAPEGADADIADQLDRPRRQGRGMNDLQTRRDQPFEIGIGPLLVVARIAGDHVGSQPNSGR